MVKRLLRAPERPGNVGSGQRDELRAELLHRGQDRRVICGHRRLQEG